MKKIRKYCFTQYFWLIIWTIPKNVNFDQKRAVRGAISQKEGIEILQDAPHIKAFWIPDQVVSSALMEMNVTLEEGCASANSETHQELKTATLRRVSYMILITPRVLIIWAYTLLLYTNNAMFCFARV